MALLGGMNSARNSLKVASNSYAEIQKQLDRYNKVFETYANASPETQIRAASVMRQALDEYNGLKRQQEENALKIFEAQQRVDYYNKQPQVQQSPVVVNTVNATVDNVTPSAPVETVPVVAVATPGTLNNNTPVTNVETNAIDTNTTMNVSVPTIANQNVVNPTTPVGVTNIISSQTPKYPNTTISPTTTTPSYKTNWPNYGPGSVATTPGTGGTVTLNTPFATTRKSTLNNTINNWVRKGATYLYNYLKR